MLAKSKPRHTAESLNRKHKNLNEIGNDFIKKKEIMG